MPMWQIHITTGVRLYHIIGESDYPLECDVIVIIVLISLLQSTVPAIFWKRNLEYNQLANTFWLMLRSRHMSGFPLRDFFGREDGPVSLQWLERLTFNTVSCLLDLICPRYTSANYALWRHLKASNMRRWLSLSSAQAPSHDESYSLWRVPMWLSPHDPLNTLPLDNPRWRYLTGGPIATCNPSSTV